MFRKLVIILLLALVGLSAQEADTVEYFDGTPWNRDYFNPRRLLRKNHLDPDFSINYSYNVSFFSTPHGTFGQNSFLAHVAYDFTDNLSLYADFGLWVPLYNSFKFGPIAKEDARRGGAAFILPDVELEYRPTENTYIRLMYVNERDYRRAYGPMGYYYRHWRNSNFYP